MTRWVQTAVKTNSGSSDRNNRAHLPINDEAPCSPDHRNLGHIGAIDMRWVASNRKGRDGT